MFDLRLHAPGRTRTCNHPLKRRRLYRLSYECLALHANPVNTTSYGQPVHPGGIEPPASGFVDRRSDPIELRANRANCQCARKELNLRPLRYQRSALPLSYQRATYVSPMVRDQLWTHDHRDAANAESRILRRLTSASGENARNRPFLAYFPVIGAYGREPVAGKNSRPVRGGSL